MILSTVDVTMIAEGLAEKSRELCHFGNSHFLSTPNGINHKDLRGHTNAQQWGHSRQQRGSQTTGDGEQWGKRVENGPDVY